MKRNFKIILGLLTFAAVVATLAWGQRFADEDSPVAAQVSPSTYACPPQLFYGRTDGWCLARANYNASYFVNGSEKATIDASGNLSVDGSITQAGNTMTFANGGAISNATNGAITLSEASEDLVGTFTANTLTYTSTTALDLVDYGTINLATDALDMSEGDVTNAGDIALDSLTADDGTNIALKNATETINIAFGTNKTTWTTSTGATVVDMNALEVQRGPTFAATFNLGAKAYNAYNFAGLAFDSTAGKYNFEQYGRWAFGQNNIVDAGANIPAAEAGGLDITAPNAATNDDHVEMFSNLIGLSGGRPMIIGYDPAFKFCATITFTDVTGSDFFWTGWRNATPATVSLLSYTDYASIGSISGNITVNDKTTGATDCGTDVITDGQTKEFCTLVSATGVVTYTYAGSPPSITDAHTLTDGMAVIPFIQLRQDADLAEDTLLTSWVVSYQ